TEPLTTNETWHVFNSGELKLFAEGMPVD
ncbi:MAG: hypothetical protein RIR02_919, partial [Pseudomonadota bacterium]